MSEWSFCWHFKMGKHDNDAGNVLLENWNSFSSVNSQMKFHEFCVAPQFYMLAFFIHMPLHSCRSLLAGLLAAF